MTDKGNDQNPKISPRVVGSRTMFERLGKDVSNEEFLVHYDLSVEEYRESCH